MFKIGQAVLTILVPTLSANRLMGEEQSVKNVFSFVVLTSRFTCVQLTNLQFKTFGN